MVRALTNRLLLVFSLALLMLAGGRLLAQDQVYWTDKDRSQIWSASLDGSNPTLLLDSGDGLSDPRGLALDLGGRQMFWADNGTNTIHRANLDGSSKQTIVSSDLTFPADIELDLAAGKMYWADRDRDWIRRANFDGTSVETVLSLPAGGNDDAPYYLALDTAANKIYWTTFDSPTIHRANLDGSGSETFLALGGSARLRDMAIDSHDDWIYWADRGSSPKIQRAHLDGSGVEDLFTSVDGLGRPHGLALDIKGGSIYWTDTTTGDVLQGNLDGSGTPLMISNGTNGVASPWGIALPEPSTFALALLASVMFSAGSRRRRRV